MNKTKILLISILSFIVLICGTIFFCSYLISENAKDKLYDSISDIPANRVGVVLGTSKLLASGAPNPYFYNRIDAAAELYHAHKVERIVISGDNSVKHYNEPQDMKDALIERGVSPDHLHIDAAGFRTLDSIVRMKEIFGQSKFTIISQKFHNERSIYLARNYGIQAIGFNAKDVGVIKGLKVNIREKFARVKVFIDITFNIKPKFLGDPILIE